jgi:hypothetical protein
MSSGWKSSQFTVWADAFLLNYFVVKITKRLFQNPVLALISTLLE